MTGGVNERQEGQGQEQERRDRRRRGWRLKGERREEKREISCCILSSAFDHIRIAPVDQQAAGEETSAEGIAWHPSPSSASAYRQKRR